MPKSRSLGSVATVERNFGPNTINRENVTRRIREGRAAFVHGSRIRGERESGSLSAPQVVAGHMAGLLLRLVYGVRFTDMAPFRDVFSALFFVSGFVYFRRVEWRFADVI